MSEDDETRVMHALRSAAVAMKRKDYKLCLRHIRVAETLVSLQVATDEYGERKR